MDTEPRPQPGPGLEWVPVADAARRLGVTETAVRRRIRRGSLRTLRETVGNHVRTLVEAPVKASVAAPVKDSVLDEGPNRVEDLVEAVRMAAEAELVSELRDQITKLEERFAAAEAERRQLVEALLAERREHQAERDRQMDELSRRLDELQEQARHRPWPGLRRWWRRIVEGVG